MQKLKPVIIVSAIFLVVVILSFLYMPKLDLFNKQSISDNSFKQTASNNSDSITEKLQESKLISSDWKAYRNEDLGFGMNYPSDWMEKDNTLSYVPKGANFVSLQTLKNFQADRQKMEESYGASLEDSFFHFSEISVSRYSSIKEVHDGNTIEDVLKNDSMVEKVGETQIDGVNAVEAIVHGESSKYTIMFENKGYYYEISLNYVSSKKSVSETERQMISSFQFSN